MWLRLLLSKLFYDTTCKVHDWQTSNSNRHTWVFLFYFILFYFCKNSQQASWQLRRVAGRAAAAKPAPRKTNIGTTASAAAGDECTYGFLATGDECTYGFLAKYTPTSHVEAFPE